MSGATVYAKDRRRILGRHGGLPGTNEKDPSVVRTGEEIAYQRECGVTSVLEIVKAQQDGALAASGNLLKDLADKLEIEVEELFAF